MSGHPGFQIIGSRDPGTGDVDLVGRLPGPAGIATVALLDGDATLVIDVADPGDFVQLTGPADLSALQPLLHALTGGNGADVLAAIDGLDERTQRVSDVAATFSPPATDPDDPDTGVFVRLGRMALWQNDIETLDRPVIDGIVDRLAFVRDGLELPDGLGVSPTPEDVLADTIDRLGEFLDDAGEPSEIHTARSPGHGDPTPIAAAHLLDELADTVGTADPGRARVLTELAGRVRRFRVRPVPAVDDDDPASPPSMRPADRDRSPSRRADAPDTGDVQVVAAAAAVSTDADMVPFDGPARFDVATGVVGLTDVAATTAIHDGDEVIVTIEHGDASFPTEAGRDGRNAPCWLRLYRVPRRRRSPHPPLLVALAPFLTSGVQGRMTAVALVPSGENPDRLVAEVSARPGLAWQSRPEQLIRYAVTLGQSAARLARRGETGRAAERWLATAQAWGMCDDDRRAQLAADHATGTTRFANIGPVDARWDD